MADIPQSNFQSDQNFDPDIKKMFKDFVTGGNTPNDNEPGENIGIDDLRAQISVSSTGTKTADLLKSLNIIPDPNAPPPTPITTTPVQFAQESRCHAFYRIIGFPVVSSDMLSMYNPGVDVIMQVDNQGNPIKRGITIDHKITVASKVDPKFEAISHAREDYVAGCAAVFAVPESVEAGVLTLTSGTYGDAGNPNVRKINAPFVNSKDPFDFDITHQSYSVPGKIDATFSLVGKKQVLLSDYQDNNGTLPNLATGGYTVLSQHKHIIKPFMVDPRIDFSIWSSESKSYKGLSKRIAVPFAPSSNFLKTSSTAHAQRPLLEKIITDRLSQTNNTIDAGQATQDVVQYVKNIKSIQKVNVGNTPVSNIFSDKIFKTSQQNYFAQYLSVMQALMKKLVDAMRIVHHHQGEYYWLPIPSTRGPENGCSIRDVPFNQKSIDLLTENDRNITFGKAQAFLSNITVDVATANATPDDRGGFAFSGFFNQPNPLTFDSSTSSSQGDLSTQNLNNLNNIRNRKLNEAAEALQIIEMIMGEFSGLGLVDIVAIIGALYVISLEDLVRFLDDDAYIRAGVALSQNLPPQSTISGAMTNLAGIVSGFYQIMDNIFQDYLSNNALNVS